MHSLREAQARLKLLGYYGGKVDGLNGPITRAAVASFQRDRGLLVDGRYGPQTDRALFELVDQLAADAPIDRDFLFDHCKLPLFAGRYRQAQVDGIGAILDQFEGEGFNDLDHLAYILATAFHETGPRADPLHFMPRTEKYNPPAEIYFQRYDPPREIAHRLGNIAIGDGFRFRGRGYVQLTGRRNYAFASEKLGLDLLGFPDLALQRDIAAKILVRGMAEGWFTGRRLGQYFALGQAPLWIDAREIVNGHDDDLLIASYALEFRKGLRRRLPVAALAIMATAPIQPPSREI